MYLLTHSGNRPVQLSPVIPTVSPAKNFLVYFISKTYIDHPVLRGHGQAAKRGEASGPRITRNGEALGVFLLPCATSALSLIAMRGLIGATPRGQPWTSAVILPHGRDGLCARRMAAWWTFRAPSLGRHVHREFMRKAALNLTLNWLQVFRRVDATPLGSERRRPPQMRAVRGEKCV